MGKHDDDKDGHRPDPDPSKWVDTYAEGVEQPKKEESN